jgi:alkylation response protein AidB-like acyl-CoA dehydrogenase
VHFTLSDQQLALADAVRTLLAGPGPVATLRAAWPDGDGSAGDSRCASLWTDLAGIGLLGAMVPEAAGGLGLDETDLLPVLQEVGYAAVPLPVAETAAVAVPLLVQAGDPSGQLPGIVAGTTRVALATASDLVPYGCRADLVLCLRGGTARLAAPAAREPVPTVDGSRAAARVVLPDGGLVSADPAVVELALARADLATAAQLIGLGRRMLDLTVGYVRERRQFGVAVGSFQAVKHPLADTLLRLELARPAVLAAGSALALGEQTAPRDVSAAVLLSGAAARLAARTAIQCHGAIGYTVEYDLHLYAKRSWALAASCDTDAHLARLADSLDLHSLDLRGGDRG